MRDLVIAASSSGAKLSDRMFMARVVQQSGNGTAIIDEGVTVTSGEVSSIACNVYDRSSSTPDAVVATPSITSSAFIALTQDDMWDADTIGCNFRHTVPGSVFTTPGTTYAVEYVLETTGGAKRRFYFMHSVEKP